jgi:hypothetical protein
MQDALEPTARSHNEPLTTHFLSRSSTAAHQWPRCLRILSLIGILTGGLTYAEEVPAGFTPLFNGKDLTGWRGGDTADHRALLALTEEQRKAKLEGWTADMLKHWQVKDGELLNDGHGKYCTTEKEYGDFELMLDYNMAPKGDSGVYLRNVPQVQIWDPTDPDAGGKLGRAKGSGGLWNNSPGAPGKDPLVLADLPAGEWNQLRVVIVGARVSVWLNSKMVVDHAILENYYDRKQPIPVRGPICLQTHGAPIKWRNLFIREIGSEEANRVLAGKGNAGYQPIWNGKDLEGWSGATTNYEIADGGIRCIDKKGGTIYHQTELGDFAARMEFKLPPGGNNGLAIRYPGEGDTAYVGMCECQILDDHYEKVTGNKLDPRQVHGSAYGMAAAAKGYQHPTGEWNFEEVTVRGSTITVELNGNLILNADLSKVIDFAGGRAHPGKDRLRGYFGFAGHNDPVVFKNVEIKNLDAK